MMNELDVKLTVDSNHRTTPADWHLQVRDCGWLPLRGTV